MKTKKPNFLLVCPPKSGSSSIANYLGEHPEVYFSPIKEPFYFTRDIIKNINSADPMNEILQHYLHDTDEKYYGLFKDAEKEIAIGEGSVNYFYHYQTVIPQILDELGDVRIIVVLRDPVRRTISNYNYQLGGQSQSIEEALALEQEKIKQNFNSFWYLKQNSLYSKPIQAYLNNFSKVKILLLEDLINNPQEFMSQLYSFLKVDKEFSPNSKIIHNQTKIPKSLILSKLIYLKRKLGLQTKLKFKERFSSLFTQPDIESIKPQVLEDLYEYFKKDISEVERILQREIPEWKR